MSDWTEVRIPVPWGYIAAKTTGNNCEEPMICVHGDMDNATSFDYLVPLLPQKYYFICIDLPGHGLSSHYSPGIPYKLVDYVFVLKRVVDYFNWEKVNILGHLSGGLLGMFFASCFSNNVEKLIIIDPLVSKYNVHLSQHLKNLENHLLESECFTKDHNYDYQILCEKIQELRPFPLSSRAEKLLMERNLVKSQGSFKLAMDRRVSSIYHLPNEKFYLPTLLYPLKCQLLLIMCTGVVRHHRAFPVKMFINTFRKNCSKLEYYLLNENNDVHINRPEKLSDIIFEFLDAKSKGNPKDWPVLCVHGIQDNANTFDHLIPLLPSSFFFVSIDLPGHGFSSHFPPGIVLDFFDYVLVFKRVVNYFQWKKIILLAHSLGAQLGNYFTALFPEIVSKVIMLDSVAPLCIPPEQFWEKHKMMNTGLRAMEQQMRKRDAPKYSYNDAINRLAQSRFSKLSKESAETLVKRSLVPNDDGYSYSTDQRLKLTVWANINMKTQISTLSRIQCPQLLIIASESGPFFKIQFVKSIIANFRKRRNFASHIVKGNHDVHLEHPDRIAGLICKFLTFGKSSL